MNDISKPSSNPPVPAQSVPAQPVITQPEVIAAALMECANAVKQGASITFQQDGNKTVFTVDSPDGTQRMIREHTLMDGLFRQSTEIAQKQPIEQRREIVRHLAEEGLTQVEIAQRTMTSQKTVSNDIQFLREHGLLKK